MCYVPNTVRYDSILQTIGNTPLVRINRLQPAGGSPIWAKLEGFNPMGSVKERIALSLVEAAERNGRLKPGMRILESSSGNTGIGLAMVGAVKGYGVTITMSRKASPERRQILAALGAQIVLTPAETCSDGAWDRADELAAEQPHRFCRVHQYKSPDNMRAHYERTATEIWEQTEGEVDALLVGLGTTGTIMGTGRRLRELNPQIRIVAVEPQEGHRQQGLRNMTTSRVPDIFDTAVYDEKIVVGDQDAWRRTRELATREGIFAGISSGSALHAAIEVSSRNEHGCLVVVFPDRGEKYISTGVFDAP